MYEENTASITSTLKEAAGWSIGWSVVMIILGTLALFLPLTTGIAVSILVGWTMFFGGFAYLAYAFAAHGAASFVWRVLVGIFYIFGGGYLAFHPGLALESLTLVMAAVFLVEGAMEIVVFFQLYSMPGSGWILFDGLVTLFLAYVIWRPWPTSSRVGDWNHSRRQPHYQRVYSLDVFGGSPQVHPGDSLSENSKS